MASKDQILHELYLQCKEINFDETHDLIKKAESKEEKEFMRLVTDFILQQKQKRVVSEKRF